MRRSAQQLLVTLATCGCGLTLAACASATSNGPGANQTGANQTSVNQLLASAKSQLIAARSLRMSGHGSFGGQGTFAGQQTLGVDLEMLRSGDIKGTITAGALRLRLVIVGNIAYVNVNKGFFHYLERTQHAPSSACAVICGKYIKGPASSFGSSKLTLNGLISQIGGGVPKPHSLVHERLTTYHGQSAYELSNAKGEELFIAQSPPHYLLGGIEPGKFTLSLSEWNSVPPITAPPASQIANIG